VSKIPLALAFASGTIIAAVGWLFWSSGAERRSAAALMDAVMWNKEPVGGPFALVDQDGQRRTDADFRGKLLLIYFGFTFCSDICPIDLQSIASALDKLWPASETVQPIFITVDPEKDTPEQLKRYVGLFHPRLVGLTGSPKEIRSAALAYKVYYAKTEPANRSDGIDHTGFTFLVGRDGQYLGFFPPGTSAGRLIETIRPHLTGVSQR
jgi:cytochrome oxidase Cu insertion factor (SCO1/SenC/PrrC family)